MNLRGIANRATRAVNPNIAGLALISTGYATGANGKQVASYAPPVPVTIQAQALTKKEVEHLDNLNISNAVRAIYSSLQLSGVDRVTKSGGDIVRFADPMGSQAGVVFDWLVVATLEEWGSAGWGKYAVSRQAVAPAP